MDDKDETIVCFAPQNDLEKRIAQDLSRQNFTCRVKYAKWASTYHAVLEVSPFDLPVGNKIRNEWVDRYEASGENPHLVFWYNDWTFTFQKERELLSWEDGKRQGFDELPEKLVKKLKKGGTINHYEKMLMQGLFEGHLEVQKAPEERLIYFHRIMQMIRGVKIGEIVKHADSTAKSQARLVASIPTRPQDDRVHDRSPHTGQTGKKRKRVSRNKPEERDGTDTEQDSKLPARNVSRIPPLVRAVELDTNTIEILESADEESSYEEGAIPQDPQIAVEKRSLSKECSEGPHEKKLEIQKGTDTFPLHSLICLLKDASNYFMHGADVTSTHPAIQHRFYSGLPVNLAAFTKLISDWVGDQNDQQNWLVSHVQSKCLDESRSLITAIQDAAREAFVHETLISARSHEIQNRYRDSFPVQIDTFADLVGDLVADHERRQECFMVLVKEAIADAM